MNQDHRSSSGSRSRLVAAITLGVAASGCSVALLITSAWLISRAAEHPPVLYLLVAVVSVRAFGLFRGGFHYLERLVGHDVALQRQDELRQRVWSALTRSTWAGRRSGDLLSRVVSDVTAVQDRVVGVLVPVAGAAVVVLGAATLLTLVHPTVGGLVLSCSVASGAVVPYVTARLARRSDGRIAGLRGQLAEAVAEAGRAAPDVLAFGASAALLARVTEVDRWLFKAERRSAGLAGLAGAAQFLLTGIAIGGALLVGAKALVAGQLAPVMLAVVVLTPLALHALLAGLPVAAQTWRRSGAALDRVHDVLVAVPVGAGEVEAPTATASTTPGAVRLEGLTAGWPGGPAVVQDLDLVVRAGEWVALTGPSGSGKTTVAATLLGLLPPRVGTVRVQGSVAYLAQDAHLFDTTVAENVRIGNRAASDAEIAAALDRAGLHLDPARLVGEHGRQVSGGEARRLALARLLLRRDAVLVLDEPTEHLDRGTADALTSDLFAATRGAAVLVLTHDPVLLGRCGRVIELQPRPRLPAPAVLTAG